MPLPAGDFLSDARHFAETGDAVVEPVGKVKTYDTAKAVFESFVGSNYDVAYNDLKIINIANTLVIIKIRH